MKDDKTTSYTYQIVHQYLYNKIHTNSFCYDITVQAQAFTYEYDIVSQSLNKLWGHFT